MTLAIAKAMMEAKEDGADIPEKTAFYMRGVPEALYEKAATYLDDNLLGILDEIVIFQAK